MYFLLDTFLFHKFYTLASLGNQNFGLIRYSAVDPDFLWVLQVKQSLQNLSQVLRTLKYNTCYQIYVTFELSRLLRLK
jgi:hypothetical protein